MRFFRAVAGYRTTDDKLEEGTAHKLRITDVSSVTMTVRLSGQNF